MELYVSILFLITAAAAIAGAERRNKQRYNDLRLEIRWLKDEIDLLRSDAKKSATRKITKKMKG